MTIPLVGTGGLFTRVGKEGGGLNEVNTFRLTTVGITRANGLDAQYQSTNQNLVDGLYTERDNYRAVHDSWVTYLNTLASVTIVQMADDDVILTSKDLTTAIKTLIAQMIVSADTIEAPVVSATVAIGTNTGDGVVVASVINAAGKNMDYIYNEKLDLLVTSDSQGSATEGQEPLSVLGDVAETNLLSWNWPRGSGTATAIAAVDARIDAGTNMLTNSDFNTFTVPNIPNNWVILVGVAGVDILKGSSPYTGSFNLQYLGDGVTLSSVAQTFNLLSGGTAVALQPSTVYAVNLRTKVSSVPAAGVLRISLVDGANVVINDAAGTANQFDISLPGETTSYASRSGFFRTPAVLPLSGQKIRVSLSTALSAAVSVHIDHLAMTPATQVYAAGPFLACFSGATRFILNDSFVVTVSNNYAGEFAKLFHRFFNMPALGLQIPSLTAGNTISDALVV